MKWMKRVCTPPRVGGRERNNLGSPLSISSSSLQLLRALLIGYAAQLTDRRQAGKERLLSVAMRRSAPGSTIVQLFSLLCLLPQVMHRVRHGGATLIPRPVAFESGATCVVTMLHTSA